MYLPMLGLSAVLWFHNYLQPAWEGALPKSAILLLTLVHGTNDSPVVVLVLVWLHSDSEKLAKPSWEKHLQKMYFFT